MLRPDPIPDLKRQLATALVRALHGWTGLEALDTIGLDPARLSDLRRGKLQRFSAEQLIRLLTRARYRVTLLVERDGHGS